MHLVQLLLPLFDNKGVSFSESTMRDIREELVGHFGGVTAFSRAPALGLWSNAGEKVRDDVVLVEVMVERLDKDWWRMFRMRLETKLSQQSIVLRSFNIERL